MINRKVEKLQNQGAAPPLFAICVGFVVIVRGGCGCFEKLKSIICDC